MITKRVYQDPRGRLHDETTGKFTRKPRTNRLSSELETPYFSQDEEKPQTYNRTGIHLEIERDGQEIFEWMMIAGAVVGVVWKLIM
jgi:hypothetical protein